MVILRLILFIYENLKKITLRMAILSLIVLQGICRG